MVVHWWRLLPLFIVAVLLVYEDRVSIPSCKVVPNVGDPEEEHVDEYQPDDDLKVMIVSDLLLLGSEAGYVNVFFRDYHLSKFFRKSFEILKPDMLLVLGDVSARGYKLTRSQWSNLLQQFHSLVGPFLGLPFHVTLGDRDIGECNGLNSESVDWVASKFPGLDSAGCGAFEISNISFVSLNSVALLCGNSVLRFGVEKVIERESMDLQMDSKETKEVMDKYSKFKLNSGDFGWRENVMSSGSGPVLLLHFPLHQSDGNCWGSGANEGTNNPRECSRSPKSRELVGSGPYGLLHTLPPNATKYIFQALRPRIVFSAHEHEFCDRTHTDGTREVTVPAMTWDARSNPGFIIATFKRNRQAVIVTHCSLASEFHVVIAYTFLLLLLISTILVVKSRS